MVEVFKNGKSSTGREVDESIRREVFILVCSQIEAIVLFLVSGLCLFMSRKGDTPLWNECLMLVVLVGSVFMFIRSRFKFIQRIQNIIIENKQIIYSCHEITFTKEYVYVNNLRPIKMNIDRLIH